jgi:hypothetical protein
MHVRSPHLSLSLSLSLLLLLLFLAGCATPPASVEVLDQSTGMTAGVLPEPIAFTETGVFDWLDPTPKQASIVYLGPVEWDRSGDLTYVLWIQLAPGVGGHRLDNLLASGAVTLQLDDAQVVLSSIDYSKVTSNPYRFIQPVGQSAYFLVNVATLQRMAASQKVVLRLRAADLTKVDFIPIVQPRDAIRQFIQDRVIAAD